MVNLPIEIEIEHTVDRETATRRCIDRITKVIQAANWDFEGGSISSIFYPTVDDDSDEDEDEDLELDEDEYDEDDI